MQGVVVEEKIKRCRFESSSSLLSSKQTRQVEATA